MLVVTLVWSLHSGQFYIGRPTTLRPILTIATDMQHRDINTRSVSETSFSNIMNTFDNKQRELGQQFPTVVHRWKTHH